jgi:hypothetical protein
VFRHVTESPAVIVTAFGAKPVLLICTVALAVGAVLAGAANTNASTTTAPMNNLRVVFISPPACLLPTPRNKTPEAG